MIKNKKISTPVENLCKGMPYQLGRFIKYSKNLRFDEKPDYNFLRSLLKQTADDRNINLDLKFDW